MSGLWTMVQMNWIFWAIPLETSVTFLFHQPSTSSRSNQWRSERTAASFSMPFSRAK